jgi:hypothetical protein
LFTSSIIFGSGFVGIADKLDFLNKPVVGVKFVRAGVKVIEEGSSWFDVRLDFNKLVSIFMRGLAGFLGSETLRNETGFEVGDAAELDANRFRMLLSDASLERKKKEKKKFMYIITVII